MQKRHIGFIGAGGIARAHIYALQALKYYYSEVPELVFESVTSATPGSRENFAGRYGFLRSEGFDAFAKNKKIDTVFILGPNNVHYKHLQTAVEMPSVKNIYLEKPVCSTVQ